MPHEVLPDYNLVGTQAKDKRYFVNLEPPHLSLSSYKIESEIKVQNPLSKRC